MILLYSSVIKLCFTLLFYYYYLFQGDVVLKNGM